MKLRIKCSGGASIVLETTAQASLCSVKQEILERAPQTSLDRGLGAEDYELSLNGTDSLDGSLSLEELGVVSGDLLYLVRAASSSVSVATCDTAPTTEREANEPQPRQRERKASEPRPRQPAEAEERATENSPIAEEPLSRQSGPEQRPALSIAFSHFQDLYHSLGEAERAHVTRSPSSMLSLALHRLMLDAGFILNQDEGIEHHLHCGSAKWSYKSPIQDDIKVHLACVQMGYMLSIHGIAIVLEERLTVKIALPVSSHVERRGLDEGESWVLARPNELANLFRDGIAHKLLTGIRKVLGLPEVGTLSALFPELKLLVCRTLDVKSLLSLSAVNRELHVLCQDPYLWKSLVIRDFGRGSVAVNEHKPWKQVYKEQFKMAVERIRRKRRMEEICLLPRQPNPFFPAPQLLPPPFPTIIGGRRDLFPEPPPHLHLGGNPLLIPRHPMEDHLHIAREGLLHGPRSLPSLAPLARARLH